MHINEANDKLIKDVLKNFYIIPRFQRPYSWQKEEVEDFLNDVIANNKEYFIGSMVTFAADSDRKGVVDGQQRLTTIILILVVIRELAKNINEIDIAHGTNQYIERINDYNKMTPVINTETSYPTFQTIISSSYIQDLKIKDINLEEKNIYEIYKYILSYINVQIDEKIKKISNERKVIEAKKTYILELREKILNLTTIYIELDNEDDAYVIFETLNTRGRDLSTEDLIKNHIMQRLTTTSSTLDSPKDNWNNLNTYISESKGSLSEFLYYQWASTHGICSQKDLFKNIRKTYSTKKSIKQYMKDLDTDKVYYRIIKTQNSAAEVDIQDSELLEMLKNISTFNVKQHIPSFILALREYKKGNISLKNLKKLCRTIENFHFKYNAITSSRTSGTTSTYKNLIKSILETEDANLKNKFIKDFSFPRNLTPERDIFKEKFSQLYYIDDFTKYKKIIKYILKRIDKNKNNKIDIPYDYDSMTIEHLVPQCKMSKISKNTIGQIGNLILAPKKLQNKLKNKDLKDKIEILKNSKIIVPYSDIFEQVLNDKISEEIFIQKRTEIIAEDAYLQIWK